MAGDPGGGCVRRPCGHRALQLASVLTAAADPSSSCALLTQASLAALNTSPALAAQAPAAKEPKAEVFLDGISVPPHTLRKELQRWAPSVVSEVEVSPDHQMGCFLIAGSAGCSLLLGAIAGVLLGALASADAGSGAPCERNAGLRQKGPAHYWRSSACRAANKASDSCSERRCSDWVSSLLAGCCRTVTPTRSPSRPGPRRRPRRPRLRRRGLSQLPSPSTPLAPTLPPLAPPAPQGAAGGGVTLLAQPHLFLLLAGLRHKPRPQRGFVAGPAPTRQR